MDVLSVLGREPALYTGGPRVRTDERRPVVAPADESSVAEAVAPGAMLVRERPRAPDGNPRHGGLRFDESALKPYGAG